jgi:hypothetical protein
MSMSLCRGHSILVGGRNADAKKDHDLSRRRHPLELEIPGARPGCLDGGADTAGRGGIFENPAEQKARPQLGGGGTIFSRGNVLWIAYSFRGKSYRESARTSDEKAARKLLTQRLKQVERPGFVGSKEDMWTLADMRARILRHPTRANRIVR